jgi:hypothetical protein
VKKVTIACLLLSGCAAMEQRQSLELLVSEAKRASAAGDHDTWAEALRRAIVQRREYRNGDTARFREPLDGELQRFAQDLRRRVAERARTAPLVADQQRNEHRVFLDELPALATDLEHTIAEGRRDACERTHALSRDQPWLLLTASHYCRLLGLPFVAVAPPELAGTLAIDTVVEGAEPVDRAWLHDQLAAWFLRTPWYAPEAKRTAVAWLHGSSHAEFDTQPERIEVPWVEQVPYPATETYQESYTAYETQTQQVTTYDSYTYPCGTSTCTGSRPNSHTETHSVPVTRYRTATRTVTRYRPEPRVFRYEAQRASGSYETALKVRVELGGKEAPLQVSHRRTGKQSGLLHEVSFPAAGVRPTVPGIPSASGWFREQAGELERAFVEALDARWRARWCASEQYNADEAARCLRVRSSPPPAALAALRTIFAADADLIGDTFQDPK